MNIPDIQKCGILLRAGKGLLWLVFVVVALLFAPPMSAEDKPAGAAVLIPQKPRVVLPSRIPVAAPVLSRIKVWDFVNGQASFDIAYQPRVMFRLITSGVRPTHFRISESGNFSGVDWQPWPSRFPQSYRFASDVAGTKRLYAQLRNGTSASGLSEIRSTRIEYRKAPVIQSFAVNRGDPTTNSPGVTLTWRYSGYATEYRVANTPYMAGASWQSLAGKSSGGIQHQLANGGEGERTVYLQLRSPGAGPVAASDSILFNGAICPRGPNGKICNGDGRCGLDGRCVCDPDYSGPGCEVVSQRCYGAIGNHCGAMDGFDPSDPFLHAGLCSGGYCLINAGSWRHDECCIRHRVNGPNAQQGSCSPVQPGPYAPDYCIDLFNMAVVHAGNDMAHTVVGMALPVAPIAALKPTWLSWVRKVDPSKKMSTSGDELVVDHAAMCNPRGGTLLCVDQAFCCAGSGTPTLTQPLGLPGKLCLCD